MGSILIALVVIVLSAAILYVGYRASDKKAHHLDDLHIISSGGESKTQKNGR